jgi:N-acetylglucosaminyldiphosphoundecaprenol N-acetyl-beta-D-mannosaminyltransferase
MEAMEAALVEAAPDIVFVGLGSPKQERLALRLRTALPATWWIGVGVSFSFVTGAVRRAPKWMQVCGVEWLHRLFSEPRRLARRYLVDGLPFAARLMCWAVARRVRG